MAYVDEVLADRPVAYWRLQEGSGSVLVDAMGGPDGAYVGTISRADSLLASDPGANKAVRFDGVTGYGRVPDHAGLDVADRFTLEAWFKLDRLPASGFTAVIIDKGGQHFILRVEPDGRLLFRRNGVANIAFATILLRAGVLYHVFITKDGALVVMIVNDQNVTGVITNSTMANNALELNIASADGGNRFNMLAGIVDEVAVYPTALPAARASAHYRAGMAVSSVNKIAMVI